MPTAAASKAVSAEIKKLETQIATAEAKLGKALLQREQQLTKDIIVAENAIKKAEKSVISTEKRTGKGSEAARTKAKTEFQAAKKELREAEAALKRASKELATVTVELAEWRARADALDIDTPKPAAASKKAAKATGAGKTKAAASTAPVTKANGKAADSKNAAREAMVAAAVKKVAKPKAKPLTRKQIIESDPNRTIPPPSVTTTPQNTKSRLVSLFDTLDSL